MLRVGELKAMWSGRPRWQGVTEHKLVDDDLVAAERDGLIERNPAGEGYIITERGRLVAVGAERSHFVCN